MAATQLIVPRCGVFGVTRQRENVIAEPNVAIFLESGSTYAVDHPSSRGDRCTVSVFDPEILEEVSPHRLPEATRLSASAQLMARAISSRSDGADDLDYEEASLALLGIVASRDKRPGRGCGRGDARKRVNDVCSLVAARPEARWRLAAIADAVHVSQFHLARQFRQVTGSTLGDYVLRLRLNIALDRIAEGESSLSRVAADAGFAHHSHMTERFRSVYGMTPSQARHTLSASRLSELPRRLRRWPDRSEGLP